MNTKDFLRLGVPLGEAIRRATDFVAQFIPGGGAFPERGIYSASTREVVGRWRIFASAGGRKLKRRERHAPDAKPLTAV